MHITKCFCHYFITYGALNCVLKITSVVNSVQYHRFGWLRYILVVKCSTLLNTNVPRPHKDSLFLLDKLLGMRKVEIWSILYKAILSITNMVGTELVTMYHQDKQRIENDLPLGIEISPGF